MEKINIAELLKECPSGMELDCTMYDNVALEFVANVKEDTYPIKLKTKHGTLISATEYGCYDMCTDAKCVIFPKGKTTWEGFVPPCKFKDGDIAVTNEGDIHLLRTKDSSYCAYRERWEGLPKFDKTITTSIRVERLATEEEKAKFFDVIKANGYKWNEETKTLEELPKFKVGDRIRHKNDKTIVKTIGYVYHNSYALYDGHLLLFKDQDMWELAPNKFEINTLKPFDKVLVRNHEKSEWQPNFFNTYCKEIKKFKLIGICTPACGNIEHFVDYCIPYEGNEHLSGKTDDCAEYFKTWK